MGGLKFDTNGRIMAKDGSFIKGLFGVGEVTGGLHGENRLAGNSLLECVVYGMRVA
jgi:succinate dehydrogenase/fumarate reductase flavoprotein subunit